MKLPLIGGLNMESSSKLFAIHVVIVLCFTRVSDAAGNGIRPTNVPSNRCLPPLFEHCGAKKTTTKTTTTSATTAASSTRPTTTEAPQPSTEAFLKIQESRFDKEKHRRDNHPLLLFLRTVCLENKDIRGITECKAGCWAPPYCSMFCFCHGGRPCDQTTGECPWKSERGFERCEPGWQGFQCNDDCDGNTFGLGCRQQCMCSRKNFYRDPASRYQICNITTGECPDYPDRCMWGWTGKSCDQIENRPDTGRIGGGETLKSSLALIVVAVAAQLLAEA